MAKVKFFYKKVKLQGQGQKVKKIYMHGKVLSQGTHMWNMKALSLTIQKLWPRLKFFWLTDRQTDRRKDFNVPALSRKRGTIIMANLVQRATIGGVNFLLHKFMQTHNVFMWNVFIFTGTPWSLKDVYLLFSSNLLSMKLSVVHRYCKSSRNNLENFIIW